MHSKTRLLALVFAALPACSNHDEPEACSPTVAMSADPTTIASGDTIELTIEVTDFTLEDPAEGDAGSDGWMLRHDAEGVGEGCEGHYHVYLDDNTMTDPILQDYQTVTSVTVTADPGPHQLIVRLNDPSHKFLKPEITDTVDITVQ